MEKFYENEKTNYDKYKKFGIVRVLLTDLITLTTDYLLGNFDKKYNSVGIYINTEHMKKFFLFNIYDESKISWVENLDFKKLFHSNLVKKISFTPIHIKNEKKLLEQIEILNQIKTCYDYKKNIFEKLLKSKFLNQPFIVEKSGYTQVNTFLKKITKNKIITIHNDKLSNFISMENSFTMKFESFFSKILNIFKDEETYTIYKNLIETFFKLSVTNTIFGFSIIKELTNQNQLNKNKILKNLIDSINSESIDSDFINNSIKYYNDKNLNQIDLININNKKINIKSEIERKNKKDKFSELKNFILDLERNYHKNESQIINIINLVEIYNSISEDKIKLENEEKTDFLSCYLTKQKLLKISISEDENIKILLFENRDFSKFTKEELINILINIDSLRSSNGENNFIFNKLQKNIIHELSDREKLKNEF
jgi:hypothetical protein